MSLVSRVRENNTSQSPEVLFWQESECPVPSARFSGRADSGSVMRGRDLTRTVIVTSDEGSLSLAISFAAFTVTICWFAILRLEP